MTSNPKPALQPHVLSASGTRLPAHEAVPLSRAVASSPSRSSTIKAPCVGAVRRRSVQLGKEASAVGLGGKLVVDGDTLNIACGEAFTTQLVHIDAETKPRLCLGRLDTPLLVARAAPIDAAPHGKARLSLHRERHIQLRRSCNGRKRRAYIDRQRLFVRGCSLTQACGCEDERNEHLDLASANGVRISLSKHSGELQPLRSVSPNLAVLHERGVEDAPVGGPVGISALDVERHVDGAHHAIL
eukprot:5059768-Prymnesium_polylepis.3